MIGKPVLLSGVGTTIVGVMPRGFLTPESFGGPSTDDWTPYIFTPKEESDIRSSYLQVWGRLNAEVSIRQAQAALTALCNQVMSPRGSKQTSIWRVEVTPLMNGVVNQWSQALILLAGAVAFLLAIACSNVANLLLARASNRQKEIAVRIALGANRRRVVRQLLTESCVLGVLGGGLGILMASGGIRLERLFLPAWFRSPNFEQMGIDSTVLIATVITSAIVGIIFGVLPALHTSNVNLVDTLKEGGAAATPGYRRARTQSAFLVVEVASSMVLLIGAGLLMRSFLKLQGVRLGFNPNQILTARVSLPEYRYPKVGEQIAAFGQLLEKIGSLPGVQSSAFVTPLPLCGINGTITIHSQPGLANPDHSGNLYAVLHSVSSGYFSAMSIPLLSGRAFSAQDRQHSQPVAIVNEAFARRYWPGQNPIGKVIFKNYPDPKTEFRVIGVVGNIREDGLWGPPSPTLYRPYTQFMFAAFAGTLIAKTRTPPSTALAVQKVIHTFAPETPVSHVEMMSDVVARNRGQDRFYLVLVGVFALLALVLAAAGVASAVSYAVSRRTHEVGIRMALGAGRSSVLFLVMGQTLRVVAVGIALGAVASLLLTRFIASQLYGIRATDPLTFVSVAFFLGLVSIFASIVPATQATCVDPAEMLRVT